MTTYSLGIDLGTSRTSIATSTGVRLTTRSVVGYPKDLIARKRFKKDFLLGDEAIDNRLSLDMVWPLAHGNIVEGDERSLQATSLILKNIIAEAIPDRQEVDQILAAVGVPAQASINNKKLILDATNDFIDKILIVSEPFAVAYAMDMFDESLIVDIGAGTVDLCRIYGALPTAEDQATLDTAGNFLDGILQENIQKAYKNVQLTKNIVRKIKEKHGYVTDTSDKVLVKLTIAGKPGDFDITDALRTSSLAMTDPICKAVQELIGQFDPEFQEKIRNNVIVAGGGSRLKGIDAAIEKGLIEYGGGSVTCVQDAEYCGAVGALKMVLEIPEDMWEKI